MAKWCGKIGYVKPEETSPGVWKNRVTERKYYGDVNRNSRRLQSVDKVNDDVVINNEISAVLDPYAINNFHHIRYAEFMGAKWKVTNVEVQRPRLLLTLGGVYNGEQA